MKIFLIFLMIFTIGCTVCNEPYMRHGDGCCLDENKNDICDEDERSPDELMMENIRDKIKNGMMQEITMEDDEFMIELAKKKVDGTLTPEEEVFYNELLYWGLISPDRFLPEKCTLPAGTACTDFMYEGDDIVIQIMNAQGFDISEIKLSIEEPDCTASTEHPGLKNGEQATFTLFCPGLEGKFNARLNFEYTNAQTTLKHTKVGEISIKTSA